MMSSCELIIEEAATPELECLDTSGSAIEDAFWTEDPDEIPVTKLKIKEFMQNVQNYMQEKGELQDVDMSRALVALTQEAASIPMPKLKNACRLRIEYQVWTEESLTIHVHIFLQYGHEIGETAQSIQPPEIDCTSQKSGNLCSKKTCFTCNSMQEANAKTVRGTLLSKFHALGLGLDL